MVREIPYRIYYDKGEIAQLTGQSVATINRRIREGLRPHPGPDAIRPEQTRQFGDRLKVHRSYLTGEPTNVTPMRHTLTQEQIEAAVENVIGRMVSRLVAGSLERIA